MYDIIIIGGGPAGLTAALYGCRANKRVLLIEKETFGGQITQSPQVENIPGFLSVSGAAFADSLVEQVLAQGAEIECAEVIGIEKQEHWTVYTDIASYTGKAVIAATGAQHRRLGLPSEETFIGNGISFCAVCDGAFYAGKTVAVIGGGNSALQEALMLSELCKKVYIIQNLPHFTGEERMVNQLAAHNNIEVRLGTVVETLCGDTTLTGITVRTPDGVSEAISVDGMFVAIGLEPQNQIFEKLLSLHPAGYLPCGEDCTTSIPGFFAAGDCRTKKIRQVATAIGDGATAALAACSFLDA